MSEHLLMGLASIVVLGVGAQWAAWRIRIPSILVLLLTTVAYLRIDTATKGEWAGRLKLAAAGVILAVLTSGALLFGLVNLI